MYTIINHLEKNSWEIEEEMGSVTGKLWLTLEEKNNNSDIRIQYPPFPCPPFLLTYYSISFRSRNYSIRYSVSERYSLNVYLFLFN